jgi:hypothetical protein
VQRSIQRLATRFRHVAVRRSGTCHALARSCQWHDERQPAGCSAGLSFEAVSVFGLSPGHG